MYDIAGAVYVLVWGCLVAQDASEIYSREMLIGEL